jgi:hypothetical protein
MFRPLRWNLPLSRKKTSLLQTGWRNLPSPLRKTSGLFHTPAALPLILYNAKSLPFTLYTEQARQAQIVSAKHLDQALHKQSMPTIPDPDHPWRKGFATPLSKHGNATPSPKSDISTLENR